MARCPSCFRHFAVLEDEDPADFGCPRCGYGTDRSDSDDNINSAPESLAKYCSGLQLDDDEE